MSDYAYIVIAAAVVFAIVMMAIPSPPRDIIVTIKPYTVEPQK